MGFHITMKTFTTYISPITAPVAAVIRPWALSAKQISAFGVGVDIREQCVMVT